MDTGLTGKSVAVTGATSNAGRGILLAFAREGARVAVIGRDESAGARVVQQARDEGAEDSVWAPANVVNRAQVAEMVKSIHDRFGAIDVLVNGVGGGVVKETPFADSDAEDWSIDIDLTLMSVLNCTREVLPSMIARRAGGRIINIGSTSGLTGDPGMAVYSAAKGAVHSFARVLAREVGMHGITVNTVIPWAIQPDSPDDVSEGSRWHAEHGKFARLGRSAPKRMPYLASRTLLGEALNHPVIRPGEVGAAAVYLASKWACFITGQCIVIDGGMMLRQP
jgi:2-hydroxycyclohexanecarboxyl-CoA dehydrogenase